MSQTAKKTAPRRKVVSSELHRGFGFDLLCTLDCGHKVNADKRAPRGDPMGHREPPKTVACKHCAKVTP